MVSHFGEVVFPSSRAFWEDDDNDDDNDDYGDEYLCGKAEDRSKLCVRWLINKPDHVRKFITMEGEPLARSFFLALTEQSVYRDATEACIVEDEKGEKIAVIYRLDKEVYLCAILPHFDTKLAGIFINEISDLLLKAEYTISIVCRHVSQFQGANVPDSPSFLRLLTSERANILQPDAQLLEQPNIIFGVGAGALSYAEFVGLPAKLYVLYIDNFALDSKSAEPIKKLLTDEVNCEWSNVKFAKCFFGKGNLYM